MGCSQSKIENEEAVARCKERKHFMKEAVSARNAFAAAHTSYATYLKNTGAALNDFVQAEVPNHHLVSSVAALPSNAPITGVQQPFEMPPPPPPLDFSPSPLQRAVSMPEIKMNKSESAPVGPIIEEEEENEMENEGSMNGSLRKRGSSSRRSGSGHSRSGTKEMMEEQADRPPMPPPPSKPETQVETHHPMTDQPQQNSTWEYFFFPSMENMPGTSLIGEEEDGLSKEENEKKTFDGKPNRVDDDVEENMRSGKDEVPEPEPAPVPKPEKAVEPPEPPAALVTPVGKGLKKVKQGQDSMEAKRIVKSFSLIQIFTNLDDDFLKASESAHEVSKMLEATRLHYHSNFADNRGHIDHSARVMRVITWNRSFKGMPNLDDGKDDFDSEEQETHATVLDKLLAWEKKLYDEVKAGELMKFEYQRKVASLNKLKKRGTNTEALEKAKASVSLLHTRYIVDMQSLDSTVSEINGLRDEQLYPRLVHLVEGMATMWKTMRDHHENQSKVVMLLKTLDNFQSPMETSEHHFDRTYQLLAVAQGWVSQFEKLVANQKGYIKALNYWLKLNLIPIESNLKEKVSSPPREGNPPIKVLLHAWQDHLEKLPDELARTAISNFADMVDSIFRLQKEEMALKRKCEDSRKELARKTRQFEDWYQKYIQKKIPDEPNPDRPDSFNAPDEIVVEKQFAVDQVKKRLEHEEDAYARHCLQVREKSLASLKNRLPDFFRAMSDFALECSKMYSVLRSISWNLNSVRSSS